MSSEWPKEYLTLPKGEQENYSEVGKRTAGAGRLIE